MVNYIDESLFKQDSINKQMNISVLEPENLIKNLPNASSGAGTGYTFSVSTDNVVTLNGTTPNAGFTLYGKISNIDDFYEKNKGKTVRGFHIKTDTMEVKVYYADNHSSFYDEFIVPENNPTSWSIGIKLSGTFNNFSFSPFIKVKSASIYNNLLYQEDFTLEERLCTDENLNFGSCESSLLKFTTAYLDRLKGKELLVQTMPQGGHNELFTFGYYKVDSDDLTADRTKREIEAHDSLYEILNADVADWYNTVLPTPQSTITLKNFRDSFFGHFQITQKEITLPNDSIVLEKTTDVNQLSGRDVIYAICQANGCFGHIGRDGMFNYIYIDHAKPLFPSQRLFPQYEIFPRSAGGKDVIEVGENGTYISCKYADYYSRNINKVVIREENGDIGVSYGTGDNILVIEGNFLLYGRNDLATIAENIYGKVSTCLYKPCEIELQGNPCLEVGDNIELNPLNGIKFATVILQRTLTGIQALRDTFIAEGNETRDEEFNTFNTQVAKLKGKTNTLERTAERTISQLEDLSDSTDSRFEQTSSAISAKLSKVSPTGQTSFSWEMTDSKMEWKSNGNTIMKTDSTGLEVKGKVTATSGYIGNGSNGFTINNTSLYNGMTSYGDTTHNGVYVGTDGIATGKGSFKVDNGGNITANSGKLGTWDFSSNGFTYSNGQGATAQMTPSGSGGLGGVAITSQSVDVYGSRESNLGNSSCTSTQVIGQTVTIKGTSNPKIEVDSSKTKIVAPLVVRDEPDSNDNFCAPKVVNGTTYIWGRYAYYNGSDRRMKEDISELNEDKASEFIMNLKPSEYRMKGESRKHHGFIAQEVKEVMNEDWAVYLEDEDEEKTLSLCYSELIADMVCTLQKQNKQIQLLQREIELLKGEQNDLR